MQRTIEQLARERSERQDALRTRLLKIRERAQALDRLEHDIQAKIPAAPPRRKGWLSRLLPGPQADGAAAVRDFLSVAVRETKALALAAAELVESGDALADARDKEWDALGSNHVGLISQGLEWRVNQMTASADDARALMKTFVPLKEQLLRLLAVLEEKRLPAPADVKELLEPVEDVLYTGFENRFRGSEADVRRQQEPLAAHFRPGSRVLDLGCGRGEFLELLKARGVEGSGVDGNGRMVEICRGKGLDVRKADLLEALAARPDGSLDGVFSSQVIEHLPPAALKRLVELAQAKLAAGGVLVLETVNPTSVFALVHIYFLDMTHQRPVHPQALAYLLESSGFADVAIEETGDMAPVRLEPVPAADSAAAALNRDIDRLNALLYAAPNYAAVGVRR